MGRIFISGDLHGNYQGELKYLIYKKNFKEEQELNKNDVVIQLGDSGILWYYKEYENGFKEDLKLAEKIAERNYTMLIVPGNHENYDLIYELPLIEKWAGKVYILETKKGPIYFAKRGEIYEINNKKIFTFSGAITSDIKGRLKYEDIGKKIYVNNKYGRRVLKKIKISHINYWPQELPNEEEYKYALENLSKNNYKVDIICTHTCPKEIIPEVIHLTDFYKTKYEDPVAEFLNKINELVYFKEWHFGHFHTNVKIEKEEIYMCHYMKNPYEIKL